MDEFIVRQISSKSWEIFIRKDGAQLKIDAEKNGNSLYVMGIRGTQAGRLAKRGMKEVTALAKKLNCKKITTDATLQGKGRVFLAARRMGFKISPRNLFLIPHSPLKGLKKGSMPTIAMHKKVK